VALQSSVSGGGASGSSMTPQERMKRRMQLALNRQCQSDTGVLLVLLL